MKHNEQKKLTIGNFEIRKTLGRGSFGKVCLAIHAPTAQPVAIKILEKRQIETTLDMQRVRRERQILGSVDHPNIVRLYQTMETQTAIYLVMEYCEKGNLYDYLLKRHTLDSETACKFFVQLLNAIEYLHLQNISHRDLKPENMLLDSSNNIKLCDFGLSNMCDPGRMLKTACGSPNFAPPEMLQGKEYDGAKSDIWSAGCILFSLLVGKVPFSDENLEALFRKIVFAKVSIPLTLELDAVSLLTKLLTKSP